MAADGKVLFVADVADLLRSHAAAGGGKDVEALSRLRSIKRSVAERGFLPPHDLASPARAGTPDVGLQDALVASAAGQRTISGRDEVRDLLIEARLRVSAADNHLDLFCGCLRQIQPERVSRGVGSGRPDLRS